MSPREISRAEYEANPFPEAIEVGNYIRTHSAKDARIAVFGSEPEIPFYAHRHSVTGHIYMYGLVEDQPYALTLQKEFMHDVETSQPEYVVYVACESTWMRQENSPADMFKWKDVYLPKHYKLVGLADMLTAEYTEYRWDDIGTYKAQSPYFVMVLKRTDPPIL
jgi:hypothetical protein